MDVLNSEVLAPYYRIEEEQCIKPANEFTQEVLDYYLVGEHVTGVALPWGHIEDKFRLRNGECTIVGGINSSGKSLACGQILLHALEQGEKCLSVSLEIKSTPKLPKNRNSRNFVGKSKIHSCYELKDVYVYTVSHSV